MSTTTRTDPLANSQKLTILIPLLATVIPLIFVAGDFFLLLTAALAVAFAVSPAVSSITAFAVLYTVGVLVAFLGVRSPLPRFKGGVALATALVLLWALVVDQVRLRVMVLRIAKVLFIGAVEGAAQLVEQSWKRAV